jgi:hypothetical protein
MKYGSSQQALSVLYHLLRYIISGIFLFAAGNKLLDPQAFASVLDDFGLLPEFLVHPAALLLIFTEIILAFGLIFNIRGALGGLTVLLLLFIAVLAYGIGLGLDVDCGCFGSDAESSVHPQSLHHAIYRNLLIFVGMLYLHGYQLFSPSTPFKE